MYHRICMGWFHWVGSGIWAVSFCCSSCSLSLLFVVHSWERLTYIYMYKWLGSSSCCQVVLRLLVVGTSDMYIHVYFHHSITEILLQIQIQMDKGSEILNYYRLVMVRISSFPLFYICLWLLAHVAEERMHLPHRLPFAKNTDWVLIELLTWCVILSCPL